MRIEEVEIYSDMPNAAIMRHPGRRFPGVLIQGDTLHSLCRQVAEVCAAARDKLADDECDELDELRDRLQAYLDHYTRVLDEHCIELPYGRDAGS